MKKQLYIIATEYLVTCGYVKSKDKDRCAKFLQVILPDYAPRTNVIEWLERLIEKSQNAESSTGETRRLEIGFIKSELRTLVETLKNECPECSMPVENGRCPSCENLRRS